ncbi:DoxX family protein [Phyllobacterium leguminum]|uniref:Putative oxidoreductase n=1 Tax=Phyllobacterium leguminum TaxID=314237 RepID=A0A318T734_9HYPH|nr:DoxX family protein [Phyllobacterium leguminum]PYE90401.1 putative oxidoreductase [Phyllobacterium leguminum]
MSGIATSSNSYGNLIGRILLSSLFIPAGFSKLTALSGTAGYFGSIGMPAPMVVAVLVGLLELVGGLAVLVGYKTRIAAILLGLFAIASAFVAHMDFANQMQLINFQKNLAIAGGFFVLAAMGAGALSLDAKLRQ